MFRNKKNLLSSVLHSNFTKINTQKSLVEKSADNKYVYTLSLAAKKIQTDIHYKKKFYSFFFLLPPK